MMAGEGFIASDCDANEWDLIDEDGIVYPRKECRLGLPSSAYPADPAPDPELEEKQRRERKRKDLLEVRQKYDREIGLCEHLSNTLRATERSARGRQQQDRQRIERKRQKQLGGGDGGASSLEVVAERDCKSFANDLLLQVEAQEPIIRQPANLCDAAEVLCSHQEEKMSAHRMPFSKKATGQRSRASRPSASNRFVNSSAEDIFQKRMSHRQLTLEREVHLATLDSSISSQFIHRHWEPVLTDLIPPATLLVQEFYANIHDLDHTSASFSTFLRGSTLRIDPDVISRILDIPRVPNSDYPYSFRSMPPFDEMASFLHGSPMTWNGKSFKTKHLTPRRMIVCRIMLTNIFPVTHYTTIPLDKTLFLYTILSGRPIDLPSHLCSHILSIFVSKKDDNLPHGCLIQRLILGLGVQFPNLPRVQLGRPITRTTFEQSQAHTHRPSSTHDDPLDDPLPEDPSFSADACPFVPPLSSISSSSLIMGQLSRLSNQLARLSSSQRRLESHVFEGFRRLDTRLTTQETYMWEQFARLFAELSSQRASDHSNSE